MSATMPTLSNKISDLGAAGRVFSRADQSNALINRNVGTIMTRARSVVAWGLSIITLLTAGQAGRAEEQFKLLDEKLIRARIVGKDITDGPHWSMYLRPDGALISSESGSSSTGSWKIRNGKLCISYPASAPGAQPECNEVWMSGTNIRMRAKSDRDEINAIVMVHRGG